MDTTISSAQQKLQRIFPNNNINRQTKEAKQYLAVTFENVTPNTKPAFISRVKQITAKLSLDQGNLAVFVDTQKNTTYHLAISNVQKINEIEEGKIDTLKQEIARILGTENKTTTAATSSASTANSDKATAPSTTNSVPTASAIAQFSVTKQPNPTHTAIINLYNLLKESSAHFYGGVIDANDLAKLDKIDATGGTIQLGKFCNFKYQIASTTQINISWNEFDFGAGFLRILAASLADAGVYDKSKQPTLALKQIDISLDNRTVTYFNERNQMGVLTQKLKKDLDDAKQRIATSAANIVNYAENTANSSSSANATTTSNVATTQNKATNANQTINQTDIKPAQGFCTIF